VPGIQCVERYLVENSLRASRMCIHGLCRVMLDATPDAYSNGALAAALQYSPLEHGKTLYVLFHLTCFRSKFCLKLSNWKRIKYQIWSFLPEQNDY